MHNVPVNNRVSVFLKITVTMVTALIMVVLDERQLKCSQTVSGAH